MPIMLVKKIIKMEISFRWVAACVSLQVAERVASIKQAAAMENNGVLIEKKFEGEMWWGALCPGCMWTWRGGDLEVYKTRRCRVWTGLSQLRKGWLPVGQVS